MRTKRLVYAVDNEIACFEEFTRANHRGFSAECQNLQNHIRTGRAIKEVDYFYNHCDRIAAGNWLRGLELYYCYAKKFLKARLPEAVENKLFNLQGKSIWQQYHGTRFAYKYAKYIVRGRLPLHLEQGCSNANYIYFLKEKGLDYEDCLINCGSRLCLFFYKESATLPENVHNKMIAFSLTGDRYAKKYFELRKKNEEYFKKFLQFHAGKTVDEVLKIL